MCCSLAHLYLLDNDNSVTLLPSSAPIGAPQTLGLFRIRLRLASLTKTHSCWTLASAPPPSPWACEPSIIITVIPSCSVITLGSVSPTCKPVPLLPVCAECPCLPPYCWPLRVQLRPRPSTSGPRLLFTTVAFFPFARRILMALSVAMCLTFIHSLIVET